MCIMDVFSKDPREMRGYERYLVRFRGHITDPQYFEFLSRAYRMGKELHRGQYRGDGVTYYFKHLRDVDEVITCELGIKDDWELSVAGWLHDSVEDGKITLEELEKTFGPDVRTLVDLLTKAEEYHKDHSSYVRRLRQSKNIRAIVLKLSDRVANLRTLGFKPDEEFQIRQINETIIEYLPLAKHLIELMEASDYWSSPARRHVGRHLMDALELQIRSFRSEYGDRIISIA